MKIIVKSTKTISFDGKLESSSDSENPSQKKQPTPIEEIATPEQNDSQTNISVNNIVEEVNDANNDEEKKSSHKPVPLAREYQSVAEKDE